jgi:membrane protease YdiL (CAAX protease family)
VLIVFGLSVSFILDLLLTLLSQLDVFSQMFDAYEQVSSVIFGGGFVLSLITIGILGPVFEELLFRGLVFGELRKIMPVKVALVLQALLFGVYHLNVVQGAYAFLLGLLIGYVYYRSNSIIAPVIIHIAINSLSVIVNEFVVTDQLEQWALAISISCVALFFLTGAFILTSKSFRRTMDDGLYRNNRPVKPPAPPVD